jgi:hypothetical protein
MLRSKSSKTRYQILGALNMYVIFISSDCNIIKYLTIVQCSAVHHAFAQEPSKKFKSRAAATHFLTLKVFFLKEKLLYKAD